MADDSNRFEFTANGKVYRVDPKTGETEGMESPTHWTIDLKDGYLTGNETDEPVTFNPPLSVDLGTFDLSYDRYDNRLARLLFGGTVRQRLLNWILSLPALWKRER